MFADPIGQWRQTQPEKVAVIDHSSGERVSYAELDARIDRMAARLRTLGVARGDRVGVLAMNRIEQIELFYGCHRVGAALVPFNWRLAAGELHGIIEDARIAICFGEEKFRSSAKLALREIRWVDLDDDIAAIEETAGHPVSNDAGDAALILYTSGSTGKPKGAVLPHRQILFNAIATTTAWHLGSDDVAAITTPFFHTGGWNVFATPLWHRGGTVVLLDKFDANSFIDVMAEARCTVALTVPTQLLMLMQSPSWGRELPSLKSFFSGGAPCPLTVLQSVRDAGYRIREGYGLTECGPNCFTIGAEQALGRPGVVGWPVPFLEMRTVDEALNDVGTGEVGELLLRGPQMFAGYLNDPVRTSEAVTPDGWLRTGDLAIRYEDGTHAIAGRRKEMYISGGENVYPGEVEAALCACPGVVEVAVVGVADPHWGEVGRAFVVPRPETTMSETEVLKFATERLARYKTPKSVVFVNELPRLGSGKVDRQALTAWQ